MQPMQKDGGVMSTDPNAGSGPVVVGYPDKDLGYVAKLYDQMTFQTWGNQIELRGCTTRHIQANARESEQALMKLLSSTMERALSAEKDLADAREELRDLHSQLAQAKDANKEALKNDIQRVLEKY